MPNPITDIRNIKVYPNGDLSNDVYHGEEYHEFASGSELKLFYTECPAYYRFCERKETDALKFGTATHTAMLEPHKFDDEVVRDLNRDDYPDKLSSDAAIKSWLKLAGVSGYSTKKGVDLQEMFIAAGGKPEDIWSNFYKSFVDANSGKTILKPDQYDMIAQMRAQVFNDPMLANMLNGATVETSVIAEVMIDDEWYRIKVRPDIITKDCAVPDYKTTANVSPDKFGKLAHDQGYWLKQAFVIDVLQAAYQQEFRAALLAQDKRVPYIPQLYWLTEQQIDIGREQYSVALKHLNICRDADVWPTYGAGESLELPTPPYLAKMYNFGE